ncbi:uncharacterized protein B0T15DRAFT_323709 [Chaetomium strumarium]|uniref:Uncharacterized protein n=1 Tax=Chaetomium strumarium TaxID=1170767 RepID=A0AAJ0GKU1_9PEZI|nr:hypothetical protein B0T15DRAFT_323709 [Chaetomium strumarium]
MSSDGYSTTPIAQQTGASSAEIQEKAVSVWFRWFRCLRWAGASRLVDQQKTGVMFFQSFGCWGVQKFCNSVTGPDLHATGVEELRMVPRRGARRHRQHHPYSPGGPGTCTCKPASAAAVASSRPPSAMSQPTTPTGDELSRPLSHVRSIFFTQGSGSLSAHTQAKPTTASVLDIWLCIQPYRFGGLQRGSPTWGRRHLPAAVAAAHT